MNALSAPGPDDYIQTQLKRFKLVDMRENGDEIIQDAITKNLGYKEFLIKLIQVEEEGKKRRLTEKLILKAGFNYLKTLDDIDYAFNDQIQHQKIRELGTLAFMEKQENIIIIGPPGVGKSMIATGIGLNACKAGKTVRFTNAKELTDQLGDALKKGNLKQALAHWRKHNF